MTRMSLIFLTMALAAVFGSPAVVQGTSISPHHTKHQQHAMRRRQGPKSTPPVLPPHGDTVGHPLLASAFTAQNTMKKTMYDHKINVCRMRRPGLQLKK